MKPQADKRHTFFLFVLSDYVYLKLQPYIQTTLETRSSNKLVFPFLGSSIIDEVAYKLQLSPNCSIHSVFHVSQLKTIVPKHLVITSELPNTSV